MTNISSPEMHGILRFKAVDGLRGIAAFTIAFFWHYIHFGLPEHPLGLIAYWPHHYSWIMVDLFFVLSGFIFFNLYGKRVASGSLSAKNFFIFRFSRLYPLHWLMLLVVIITKVFRKYTIGVTFFVFHNNDFPMLIQNILLIQNGWLQTKLSFNGPAWSISIEIMMYLLFFIAFHYLGNGKRGIIACLFFIVLGLIINFSGWNIPFFNIPISRGLMGFFMGCIVGKILYYYKNNTKARVLLVRFCVFAFLILTVLPIIYDYSVLGNWGIVYSLIYFPLLLLISLEVGILSKLLSFRLFVYLGEISYSIYLIVYPFQFIVRTVDEYFHLSINYSNVYFFIAFTLSVIFISHIVHYYYEKPIQNYIRKKYCSPSLTHVANT
jgi:peptidoglycan/LPS O-acetylase OafA/YrhL